MSRGYFSKQLRLCRADCWFLTRSFSFLSFFAYSLLSQDTRTDIQALLAENGDFYSRHLQAEWSQIGNPLAVTGGSGDGRNPRLSLSSDGSRVAMGLPFYSEISENMGLTFIFNWDQASFTWEQLGGAIGGEASGDQSGRSVSLSEDGSRVAIGAPYSDNSSGLDSGYVRVYQLNGDSWQQMGANIIGEGVEDYFGQSVSLSADGSRVAIGTPSDGRVRIFAWNNFGWYQLGANIDGDAIGDQSGLSVSLSADGSRIAIGAPRNGDAGTDSGHVRVYQLNGNTWEQVGADIDGEFENDWFGTSVSLSADGSRVASGAPDRTVNGASFAGHARVLDLIEGSWVQLGPTFEGEAEFGLLGRSVSLSADGSHVALTSAGDNNAGQVRVYKWSGTAWEQVGSDINGEAGGEFLGEYVSLSVDGSRVAIAGASLLRIFQLVVPSSYSWYIARVGDVIAAFSGTSTNPEIEINYEISTAQTGNVRINLYDFDTCSSVISDADLPITIASDGVDSTTTASIPDALSTYKVLLDIATEYVFGSSIWTNGATDTQGEIKFCIRTELVEPSLGDESVSFAETKITLGVSLSASFDVNGIAVQAVQDDLESEAATTSYRVVACHCDENLSCHASPVAVVANSILRICVETPAGSEVVVESVTSLNLLQDTDSDTETDPVLIRAPIVGGISDALTTSTVTAGKAVIETRLTSVFFESDAPGNIDAAGVVTLVFANGARSLVRITTPLQLGDNDRTLQDAAVGEFDVSVPVQPMGQESGSTAMVPVIAGVVSGFAVIAMVTFFVVVRHRCRRSKHQESGVATVSGKGVYHKDMTGSSDGSSSESLP